MFLRATRVGMQRSWWLGGRLMLCLLVLSTLVAGTFTHKRVLYSAARHVLSVAKHAVSSSQPLTGTSSAYAAAPSNVGSTDTVVVDLTPRRTLPAGFFGINYGAFWDAAQGSAASARALAQTPIRTLRFPGGIPGDWYDWQDPYYKKWSSTSPLDLWHYAQKLGAKPLFQTNYQRNVPNPPGKPYAANSPQNAAAWAAYDRRSGIPAMMEVGNEEDSRVQQVHDSHFQPYITAFNAQALAMHQADPDVKVIGPAGTNEYQWWNRDSLGMFLNATGNRRGTGQVDGVSVHFYRASTWYDARNAAQYWLSPNGPWAAIQQRIAAYDTRALPVYITEWNLGASNTDNAFNPTVGHALAVADMLGAFAQSGVTGEDYFQLHSATGWGLLYGKDESRPVDSPTPSYYATALWGHMGNRMLSLQQSDDPSDVMSTYATSRSSGSLQVLAVNKQPASHQVRITLNGASAAGHHLHIYTLAPAAGSVVDLDALYNGAKMPSPQQPLPGPKDGGIVRGNSLTYTVPGYAAVALDLDGSSRGPTLTARQITDLLAGTAARATPIPYLAVIARGRVSNATRHPGQTETLYATLEANNGLGAVLVDLEVYDASGKKIFQQTRNVTLQAGRPITVSQHYALPGSMAPGTYTYKIGVFGPNWAPMYTWNDSGGNFTVA